MEIMRRHLNKKCALVGLNVDIAELRHWDAQ